MQPFLLGVNYWPRRKAMYWWSDFDRGEVDEDFALIRELGMTTVRIFLLWDAFQPTPDSISTECLRNLTDVCNIAVKHHLTLNVTFFTGLMSGPRWVPDWLRQAQSLPNVPQVVSRNRIVPGGYRNPYTDPVALSAERYQLHTIVRELKTHPAIWTWNLGNEPDLFAWPPDDMTGRTWAYDMANLIRSIDDTHPVTWGLHAGSLQENNHLRVDQIFAETDLAVMHAYPMYTSWIKNPLDANFVPFTAALSSALCNKPVLMEEFGGATAAPGEPSQTLRWRSFDTERTEFLASEEALSAYYAEVLPKLVEVGATGAMNWCFADYAPELWDKPPCSDWRHERFFGLIRGDGSLKPHASIIKGFADGSPTVKTEDRHIVTLGMTPDEYYLDPITNMKQLYERFCEQSPILF